MRWKEIWAMALVGLFLLLGPGFRYAAESGPDTAGAQIVFHGDISDQRQKEIRASFEAVAAWFNETYDDSIRNVVIDIGADRQSVAAILQSQGLPSRGVPCFWASASYVLVDGCEDPLPLARLYVYEMAWRLAGNPSIVVEDGHYRTGPVWLLHGAEEYGETIYRVAAGEAALATKRMALLDRSTIDTVSLENVETRSGFFSYDARPLAWLAVDYLVSHAGESAYIDYFRLRRQHERWETAFEDAFDLTPDEFYAAFPSYREQLRADEAEAERVAYWEDWWLVANASGRIERVNVGDAPRLIAWHGIDVSASLLFQRYPQLEFVAQWSPSNSSYQAAIRAIPSTHANVPLVSRNSVILIALNDDAQGWITLPSMVHSRVPLRAGGNLAPWLGPDDTPLSEISSGLVAASVQLAFPSRTTDADTTSSDGDEHFVESEPNVKRGDLLWVVVQQPSLWLQDEPRQQLHVTATPTIELLNHPELAEIAETEFKVVVVGGAVSTQDQEVLRARLADSIAFLRERYGTSSLLFNLNLHGADHGEQLYCGTAAGGDVSYWFWCRDWTATGMTQALASSETMTHEYFHLLQHHWNPNYNIYGQRTPSWLIEGSAFYSEMVYWDHRGLATLESTFARRAEQSRGAPLSLSDLAENWQVEDPNIPIYPLAFLAVTRLVEVSGNPDSWIDFWRPWNGRDRWEVFEEIFGITLEDFYVEFEAWRTEHYPPW